jgi:hypothetical protein
MPDTFELSVLDDAFVVTRLDPATPLPPWAMEGPGLVAICRTDEELSIICEESRAANVAADAPRWRALKVHGPFSFDAIGVLATLSQTLAQSHISLLAVSTHDTDYLFVRTPDLARAVRALRHAGQAVHTSPAPDAA